MLYVRISGDKELQRVLKKLPIHVRAKARDLVQEAGLGTQRDARKRCPVDTGRLRSSINLFFSKGGLAALVGTVVSYAKFVEFGTGRRGSEYGSASMYDPAYRYGKKPGIYPQPYLFPAFEINRARFIKGMNKLLKDL